MKADNWIICNFNAIYDDVLYRKRRSKQRSVKKDRTIVNFLVFFVAITRLFHCYLETTLWESVRIRSFPGPYFPAFKLFPYYSISLRIHSEYWKIRTRKTPNANTFHAVPLDRFAIQSMTGFYIHTDLHTKSVDWFLYDKDLRHERVNCKNYGCYKRGNSYRK